MPVVAAIGGIASAAAGIGAVTAAGGFAAMSLGSAIMAGVQIVSGVAATLGAVTGNKTLQKVGLIGAAAGAAVSGLNSLTDGALLGTGTNAADMMGSIKDADVGSVTSGLGSVQQTSAAIDAAEGGLLGSAGMDASSAIDAANAAAGYGTSAAARTATRAAAQAGVEPTVAGAITPTGASAEMAAQTNAALNTGAGQLQMPGVQLPQAPAPSSGLLGSVLDFTNKNPGAVKLVTGLGGGLAQGYMTQQAEAAKQAALDDARRRYNASILNQGRV